MKKLFALIFLILGVHAARAQDTLNKNGGSYIVGRITEVNNQEIRYKNWGQDDGPTYVILKTELSNVHYADGTVEYFNSGSGNRSFNANSSSSYSSTQDLFYDGKRDAHRYYSGYHGAGTGTFLTTLFAGPIFGLIPAIACSSTPPKDRNLNYPSRSLMDNRSYAEGYNAEAFKIKRTRVWLNWAIPTAITVALVAAAGGL